MLLFFSLFCYELYKKHLSFKSPCLENISPCTNFVDRLWKTPVSTNVLCQSLGPLLLSHSGYKSNFDLLIPEMPKSVTEGASSISCYGKSEVSYGTSANTN